MTPCPFTRHADLTPGLFSREKVGYSMSQEVCAKLTSLVQEKPGCFTAFFLCVLGLYWDECVLYLALKGYG